MTPRLATGVLVAALIRRAQAAGGHGTVLAKGDAQAGGVLLLLAARGVAQALVERRTGLDGRAEWAASGPGALDEPGVVTDYVARRRRSDGDLWVVEIDADDARRIADEVLGGG